MFDKFKSFFSFRTNGNELLTKSASQWLNIGKVIVIIMATTEALSWGYFGSLLGSTSILKLFIAALLGTFIFLVVWAIDATLVTLDRGKTYYDHKIYGFEKEEEERKLNWLVKLFKENEVKVGVFVRILMISLSIIITAPFLNQLVFNREINIRIEKAANEILSSKRDSLEKKYDRNLQILRDSLSSLQDQRTRELAGKGLSQRYGEGVVTRNITDRIKEQSIQIKDLESKKTSELAEYDNLIKRREYDKLAERFGVDIPQNSLSERSKVIEPILATADASRFETAIRSFLGFLFLALILLKFFEPRGIRIYLSEALQQAYINYKNGAYDKWIKSEERFNGNAPMQPYRFEEFMVNTYPEMVKNSRNRERDEKFEANLESINDSIEKLEEERIEEENRLGDSLNPLRQEVNKFDLEISTHENKIADFEIQINDFKSQTKKCDEAISEILQMINVANQNIDGSIDGRKILDGHREYLKTQQSLKNKIAVNIRNIEKQEGEIKRHLATLKINRNNVQTKLNEIEAPLKDITKRINELRIIKRDQYAKFVKRIAKKMSEEDDD